MMRNIRYAVALGALLGVVAGCETSLDISNPNDPDRPRILSNPSDAEQLGAALYQQINSGTLGNIARVQTGLMSASLMNGSSLANNGLGPRSLIPRAQVDNGRGNAYATENYNDFRILQQTARAASDVLARALSEEFALGTDEAVTRLQSWTYFVYGLALGTTAMVYDSAAIPRPTDAPADEVPLSGYQEVMDYALQQLDEAEALAESEDFEIDGWLRGNTIDSEEFARIIRSHRARLRAGVARTPADRAAVDWNSVIADATNGIEADLIIDMAQASGWDVQWLASTLHFRDANWHQMPYYIIGMADTSGAYETWLGQERDARTPFTIRTPDERFPSGDTRAEQNAVGQAQPPAGVYFRNRAPGLDQAAVGWQASHYDHFRFYTFGVTNGRNGDFPVFTKVENDMLAAEGYLRTGQTPLALPLINASRTAAGLPAIVGATSPTDPVPGDKADGGALDCVPQVPSAATPTTTVCGSVFEAMKWEKRMETAYTTYGAWYFDSRGWGDLPEGTFLSMPVPYQELDARRKPLYNLGGIGGEEAAAVSTYGFGSGNR
jgi:hypothetical protein